MRPSPPMCFALALAAWAGPLGCGSSQSDGTGTAGHTGSAGASGSAGTTGGSGTTGTAGTTGSAGTTGTAGTTDTAGSTGTAGTTGTAGSTGTAGTTGAAGTAGASCTVTPTAMTSTKIGTVGIVTFTTTATAVTSAQIDFGLTNAYGMTAPVDLTAQSYRTLLLGMKASKTYHYRVTVTTAAGSCQSADTTIMTGPIANGLQKPALTPSTAAGLSGGFLVTGQYVGAAGNGSPAYILDADGDFVWWYLFQNDVTGARMSYDGKYMWVNGANVPMGGGASMGAHVYRVSMDGLTMDDFSTNMAGLNHQLTVEPDETVAYYAYSGNGCDDIKEFDPKTKTTKTVVNSQKAEGLSSGMCHVNNIQYSKDDDTLVFSDLDHNTVVKVKRSDGSTVWNLNGQNKTFTGQTWSGGEHGIHLLGLDHLIIFNNNNDGTNNSTALELMMDLNAKTLSKVWSYTPTGQLQNQVMGDVQRMPNGNTIVGFSTKGTLHEVNAAGTLLQTWSWPTPATFGYIEKRPTLYGPPPR